MLLGESASDTFSQIRRMSDARFPHEIAAIMPGEYFVSSTPMIVYTVLGSCVSACIRDPILQVGGMNHFMLPRPNRESPLDGWGESARYGNYAMERLINEILKRGGRRERLEVKIFGGGRIYAGSHDVGAHNASWVIDYLRRKGMTPVAIDTGGVHPRKIYYFTATGRVLMKRIERIKNRTIFEREAQYQEALKRKNDEDSILF